MALQLKILAVDDEVASLDLFRGIVEPLGYQVVGLTDSRAAAQRIMQEKFDMVALDVNMPHLNGFELAGRVRGSPLNQTVPIFMFTACNDIATMRDGYAAGVTFYIVKPLSVAKLRGLFGAARGMMIQERRRYIRLPFEADVIFSVAGRRFKGRSVDLGQGGISLRGSCGLADGDIAEVEFSVPGESRPLNIMSKVIRTPDPRDMALEFIEPEPTVRAALMRFVAAQIHDGKAA